jgi:hypothetical protein
VNECQTVPFTGCQAKQSWWAKTKPVYTNDLRHHRIPIKSHARLTEVSSSILQAQRHRRRHPCVQESMLRCYTATTDQVYRKKCVRSGPKPMTPTSSTSTEGHHRLFG